MAKHVIAIDIDEVLFPMTPNFLEYHNELYGTKLSIQHKKTDFLEEVTGETAEQMLAKLDAYIQTERYLATPPIEGSVEAIRKLSDIYHLVLITARTPACRQSTSLFINKYFKGMFKEVHYTHDQKTPHIHISKRDICKRVGAQLLIDDSLRNVLSVAESGLSGVLFGNYPWNQAADLPENVMRCTDWQGVVAHLEARKNGSSEPIDKIWKTIQSQTQWSLLLAKRAAGKALSR